MSPQQPKQDNRHRKFSMIKEKTSKKGHKRARSGGTPDGTPAACVDYFELEPSLVPNHVPLTESGNTFRPHSKIDTPTHCRRVSEPIPETSTATNRILVRFDVQRLHLS